MFLAMADQDTSSVYALHTSPCSLYSLMAHFAFVLGQRIDPETAPAIDIRHVNLETGENLSEPYLTEISQKGQVPVLTSPTLAAPIDDSHEISRWLCRQQPRLVPEKHRQAIGELLDELYEIHAVAFSTARDVMRNGIPNQAAALLEDPSLSQRHRRALEIKSMFHDSQYSRALEPDNMAQVENQTRHLMQHLALLLEEHRGSSEAWIFGDQPTILDAHAAVLVARMMDLERLDLIPDRVRVYANSVKETAEWEQVTQGQPTFSNASLGPITNR